MKKKLLSIFAFVLILVACSSPQTSTPIPNATLTPTLAPTNTPTPTFIPEFIEIQEEIAATSKRFALLPDGSVTDNGTAIQGLKINENGEITLTVGDQQVNLPSSDISFSYEKGIEIKGYLFEQDTNEWNPIIKYAKRMNIIFTSAIEDVQVGRRGPTVSGSTNVDGHPYRLNEITIIPETLAKLIARAQHNIFMPQEEDNDANLANFTKTLTEIQSGERPCEELTRTIKAYDFNGSGEAENITLTPDCGSSVSPAGIISIKKVHFVYGNYYTQNAEGETISNPELPWIDMILPGGTCAGMLIDKEKGELWLFTGVSPFTADSQHKQGLAKHTELVLDWLAKSGWETRFFLKSSQPHYELGLRWFVTIGIR